MLSGSRNLAKAEIELNKFAGTAVHPFREKIVSMRNDAKVKHSKKCAKLGVRFVNEGQLDKARACEKSLKDEIPDASELKIIAQAIGAAQRAIEQKQKAEQDRQEKGV